VPTDNLLDFNETDFSIEKLFFAAINHYGLKVHSLED